MSNLLVVDWDFFFPNPMEAGDVTVDTVTLYDSTLYDWGHQETMFHINGPLWNIRAQSFLRAGVSLPQCSGFEGFWDRFTFSDDATLHWAESNSLAIHVPGEPWWGWGDVWLFDAHHDAGYGGPSPLDTDRVTCENWMVVLDERGCELFMRYPQWRPRGIELEPEPQVFVNRAVDDGRNLDHLEFDAVFVCRSGAWVPPWNDHQFKEFLEAFPRGEAQRIDDDIDVPMIRGFDLDEVRKELQADKARIAFLRDMEGDR